MSEPVSKECPRCQRVFECHVDSVSQCHCSAIEISTDVIEYVKTNYDDCLCQRCLITLGQELQGEKEKQKN